MNSSQRGSAASKSIESLTSSPSSSWVAGEDGDAALHSMSSSITPSSYNSAAALSATSLSFLPDFTEHPKPKRKKPRAVVVIDGGDAPPSDDNPQPPSSSPPPPPPQPPQPVEMNLGETDITFFHDFVAGGVAGSASVVVGHPFDTYVCVCVVSCVGMNQR
jgi:hypothetical protein